MESISRPDNTIENPKIKYIVTKAFGVIELNLFPDGLWRDGGGTIFAIRREGGGIDPVDQCGIAPFAIPVAITPDDVLAACRVHDYMYETPAYQLFHTRSEADDYLERAIARSKHPIWKLVASPFRWLARQFGRPAWENDATND